MYNVYMHTFGESIIYGLFFRSGRVFSLARALHPFDYMVFHLVFLTFVRLL